MYDTNNQKYIFVDFFDTLIFRRVSVQQALLQWAFCLRRKFPEICRYSAEDIVESRKTAFSCARKDYAEPKFKEAMQYMYSNMPDLHNVEKDRFVEIAEMLDIAVEYGCQYPNSTLISNLKRLKKHGVTIVCVSDFYHESDVLKTFLSNCNVDESLLDGIYVSCEHGYSKAKGNLYNYVLKVLSISDPSEVLMIGDNLESDRIQAEKNGLRAGLDRHLIHKGLLKIKARLKTQYSDNQLREIAKYCYKSGYPFSEYVLVFFEYINNLVKSLKEDDVHIASFMAREGYYLKLLFDQYCSICLPEKEFIQTKYFRCSRRSIFSGVSEDARNDDAQEPISIRNWLKAIDMQVETARSFVALTDEELDTVLPLDCNPAYRRIRADRDFDAYYSATINDNREAFLNYISDFLDDGKLNVVDSGWKGTTQAALYNYYGIPSTGYYIGIQKYSNCPDQAVRKGLIFEEGDDDYYDYVGMNFPFYQELLAAPHGSAIKYVRDDNGVRVKEEWDPLEKDLYNKRIKQLQSHMMTIFMGLCAWKNDINQKDEWIVAKAIFHSNMFAYGERLSFARDCEKSFFVNFQQEKKGAKKYDYKEVPLRADILTKPEKYIRYFSKIQRSKLYENKVVRLLYPPTARCYYGYTVTRHKLKRR